MIISFSFIKLIYIILSIIPLKKDFKRIKSILIGEIPENFLKTSFYIDNIFFKIQNFKEDYRYIRYELFPKIEWTKLKLLFNKIKLFMIEVLALKLLYKVGGLVIIKLERINKIKVWLVPKEVINVRKFLRVITMIRR